MRPILIIGVLALALAQIMALPGRAPGEAKRNPAVIEPKEPPPPEPIEVIRRLKVEKSLPIEAKRTAQSEGPSKPEVKQGEKGKN